jgi:hypothetical protein
VTATLFRLAPVVLLLAAAPAAANDRAEVLLYYANETAPDEAEAKNYATMQAWFRGHADPKLKLIADHLEDDRVLFQAATDLTIGTLARGADRAIFFTNRTVRTGKCLVVRPGQRPTETPFAVPPDPNYVLTSNPLAKAETLAAALAFAGREFPPETHEFVLVVKSHGNAKRVITPRWIVRAEETTREEVLAVAAGTHAGPLPAWAGKLGIGKAEFLGVLAASGLRFPLVDVEACGTPDSPEFAAENLPPNVARLMHVGRGKAYKINLLWSDVLWDRRPGERLWESMLRHRPAKFVVAEREPGPASASGGSTPSRRFPWWYFAPLGVWSLWASYRLGRHRAARIPV